jgi:GTP-binding protein EngB required for normal cell division
MSELEIISYTSPATSIGNNMQMHVRIFNKSRRADFAGGILQLDETQYFAQSTCVVPPIARDSGDGQGSYVDVSFAARCTPGHKTFAQIDGMQSFTLLDCEGNSVHCKTSRFRLPMYSFSGDVLNVRPVVQRSGKFINILLFGIAGAGKSTFMNTVLTLLSDEYTIVTKANMGGAGRHVTLCLTAYELTNKADGSKRELRFWDTWGLLPNTWQSGDLELLLKGVFPQNWDMQMTYDQFRGDLEKREAVETQIDRRIHCVLLFVPQQAMENGEHLQVLQEAHERIAKLVPNPIIVLTKLDEVDESLRRDAGAQNEVVKREMRLAATKFNVPINQVFHSVNYVDETEKEFHIEKHLYRILDKARSIALSNYDTMSRTPANGAASATRFIF